MAAHPPLAWATVPNGSARGGALVGGRGGGTAGGEDGEGRISEPVSKDVQPAVRKAGAFEGLVPLVGGGGVQTSETTGGVGGDAEAREVHPDFLATD